MSEIAPAEGSPEEITENGASTSGHSPERFHRHKARGHAGHCLAQGTLRLLSSSEKTSALL